MPSPLPYFAFWARDWLSSSGTRDMSLAARGAYIDLLSYQWEDGDIPDSLPVLARRLGVSVSEFQEIWPEIAPSFAAVEGGRLRNQRLHEEREACLLICERNRENGAKGGRPRNPNETQTKPKENRAVSSGLSHSEPSGFISVIPDESERITQTEPSENRTPNPNETQTKPIPEPISELVSPQKLINTTQDLVKLGGIGGGGSGEGDRVSEVDCASVTEPISKAPGENSSLGMVRMGSLAALADPVFDDDPGKRPDPDAVCDALSDPSRFRIHEDDHGDPPFAEIDHADEDTAASRRDQIRRLRRGAA